MRVLYWNRTLLEDPHMPRNRLHLLVLLIVFYICWACYCLPLFTVHTVFTAFHNGEALGNKYFAFQRTRADKSKLCPNLMKILDVHLSNKDQGLFLLFSLPRGYCDVIFFCNMLSLCQLMSSFGCFANPTSFCWNDNYVSLTGVVTFWQY